MLIADTIRSIIKENLIDPNVMDRLNDDDSFEKLDLNSIASIKIVVAIEDAFGFEFDNNMLDLDKFVSISKLSLFIEKKIGDK